ASRRAYRDRPDNCRIEARSVRVGVSKDASVAAVEGIEVAVVALLATLNDAVAAAVAVRVGGIDRAIAVIVGGVGARGFRRLGRVVGGDMRAAEERVAAVVGADVGVVAADRRGVAGAAGGDAAEARQALVLDRAVARRVPARSQEARVGRAGVAVVAVRVGGAAASDRGATALRSRAL